MAEHVAVKKPETGIVKDTYDLAGFGWRNQESVPQWAECFTSQHSTELVAMQVNTVGGHGRV